MLYFLEGLVLKVRFFQEPSFSIASFQNTILACSLARCVSTSRQGISALFDFLKLGKYAFTGASKSNFF
jgi:hypothetical protein